MPKLRSRRTLGARTPDDFERLAGLRRMQAVALALLGVMAVVFAVSFALQQTHPAWGFVRAASEGGMVGALADWFAVTALFRHPLGVKIPHTNLISKKKDEIGQGLGSFIEENFLSDDVVHEKLSRISGARAAGEWLQSPENAERVTGMASSVALGALTVLDDRDVQELLEVLVRKHVVEPEWGSFLGRSLDAVVDGDHHETLIDVAFGRLSDWLAGHPAVFDRVVSSRLPSWVPGIVDRFIDQRLHAEAVRFTRSVATDADHPLRAAITRFLRDLARDLDADPALREQLETLKHDVFESERIRDLMGDLWRSARVALVEMFEDENSDLRRRMTLAAGDFGRRLLEDRTLQYKIDVWVMTTVEHLVHNYRHDIAQVITETVERWDAREAAEKIELQVGRDLQFIRINGTIVGSLAGLTIYTLATLVIAPLT